MELIFFCGILLLLAGGLYVPLINHLKIARINRAIESAHTVNTLLSQYATDNNGVYPVGEGTPQPGTSVGIALNLLQNSYTPDVSEFSIGSTPRYEGSATDYADLAAANMSWDFTAGATATTGLTGGAADQVPTVFTTGETFSYPAKPGVGLDLALSGKGPFGEAGMVVAYKGGSAVFIKGTVSGATATCLGFIPKSLNDLGPYTQIKP